MLVMTMMAMMIGIEKDSSCLWIICGNLEIYSCGCE